MRALCGATACEVKVGRTPESAEAQGFDTTTGDFPAAGRTSGSRNATKRRAGASMSIPAGLRPSPAPQRRSRGDVSWDQGRSAAGRTRPRGDWRKHAIMERCQVTAGSAAGAGPPRLAISAGRVVLLRWGRFGFDGGVESWDACRGPSPRKSGGTNHNCGTAARSRCLGSERSPRECLRPGADRHIAGWSSRAVPTCDDETYREWRPGLLAPFQTGRDIRMETRT
jgi:hypothetical protein